MKSEELNISFTKMHGCGNDYIYVNVMEHPIADPSAAAIAWSDRHKGIGSDGLVLIDKSPIIEADFSMRIFNADGSEAKMCGNASRCIGKYLYERGITDKETIRLLTLSGIKTLNLHIEEGVVKSVTVDMGEPSFKNKSMFVKEQGARGKEQGLFVSMGNPHYVIFTEDVDQVGEIEGVRCNTEFAKVLSDGSIRVRVWELGSGITQACGTGACATAVAAAYSGITGRKSRIVMDGGTLDIVWDEHDNHVYMTGPAEFVFDGKVKSE